MPYFWGRTDRTPRQRPGNLITRLIWGAHPRQPDEGTEQLIVRLQEGLGIPPSAFLQSSCLILREEKSSAMHFLSVLPFRQPWATTYYADYEES
jgi:hypothetical protein